MPAIRYSGGDDVSERRETAASVMLEIDEAADTLSRRTGLGHAKAVSAILQARPTLYDRYKTAKRQDFAS